MILKFTIKTMDFSLLQSFIILLLFVFNVFLND